MKTQDNTATLLALFDKSGSDRATMRKILEEILVALNGKTVA
jgi:hypothetical protein